MSFATARPAALALLALLLPACGGERTPVENGRIDFLRACSSCHGPEGQGIGRLGNALRDNDFVRGKSDDELVRFLKVGRAPGDPGSKTGVLMPPKGMDPRLSDEDLRGIVLYIRTWYSEKP